MTANPDDGNGSQHNGWLCTYYVYDDYGNMRYVITPKVVAAIDGSWAISQALADELCFRTEYDLQNRPVIQKKPGAGETWMVYDQRGRVVMSQDASLRQQKKWQYFQYDALDRIVAAGLLNDGNDRMTHQNNAATASQTIPTATVPSISAYPNLASYTTELLTQTYYDNYSWAAGANMPSVMDLSNASDPNYFYAASNSTAPFAQPLAQTKMTRGMTTGSKVEVLGSNGTKYLHNVSFYDDKGRLVQAQGTNITGGVDKTTMQYSWGGQQLRSLLQHVYAGAANPQMHTVLTKSNYDAGGRLTQITKTINSNINGVNVSSAEKIIASYGYDETGRVKTENLGTKPGTSLPLETRTVEYNVRGWLLGINRACVRDISTANPNPNTGETFTTPPSLTAGNFFGFELGYDRTASVPNAIWNAGYQYAGNITGAVWKLANDGQIRKYDYAYDNAGQLISADFNQYTGNGFNKNSGVNYSVSGIDYDYNGNIQHLTQYGLPNTNATASVAIDQLTYNYTSNTNKLQYVQDAVAATIGLGDFADKNTGTNDYTYDNNGPGNGNLTQDLNRGISSIQYNLLDIPQLIQVSGKGQVAYTYDATGNKLQKIVTEGAVVTVNDYVGGFVYKNNVLQLLAHEQGRARLNGSSYVFDYFLKDNLGNIRMVLTDDPALAANPILEARSYYPMGLPMVMLNKISASLNNRYGYQGKEMQNGEWTDGTGLEMYDFEARFYDQQLGRWHTQDPEFNFSTPYDGMHNNPISFIDPDGRNPLVVAAIVGAVFGGYGGFKLGEAKGATGWGMAGYIFGGAVIGAASGYSGASATAGGGIMSNTAGIITGSMINSGGMSMLSGGTVMPSVSFGAASFDFGSGEFSYLGKAGNSFLGNLGYTLGALANFQDLIAGVHGTNVDVKSRKMLAGHSEVQGNYNGNDLQGKPINDICISVGPADMSLGDAAGNGLKWEMPYVMRSLQGNPVAGQNLSHMSPTDHVFRTPLYNVNGKWLINMTARLDAGRNLINTTSLKYGLLFGCVNYTSRALLFAGVINFNAFLPITAPVLLNAELAMRQIGIYASPFLISNK